MAPRPRPLLAPPNDGTQKENRLDLRVALKKGAGQRDQVVRHRCHNRRCVNPEHLEEGSRADNVRDERERRANGVDPALL
ncbi:HNH endonuclease [Salinihabitans flavidus]|uniref:HNH endonuclease n=1 Tax=Salinihabitans flavidus TaxID=569882 RepID=UPI00111437D6